jgi:7-carboxy-7-deazaguanine synthase
MKVSEIFYSIQGESGFAGWPCIFVRLAGCNLRCRYCDTSYAYDNGQQVSVEELFQAIAQYRCKMVEITGGEPLIQEELYEFTRQLLNKGYKVLLETNGSLDINRLDQRIFRIMDLKSPGSGMSDKIFWGNLKWLTLHDQIKFVLCDSMDYLWAKEIIEKYSLNKVVSTILLSPAYPKLAAATLAEWILKDGLHVRLNLQLHKYIWPDKTRGV